MDNIVFEWLNTLSIGEIDDLATNLDQGFILNNGKISEIEEN